MMKCIISTLFFPMTKSAKILELFRSWRGGLHPFADVPVDVRWTGSARWSSGRV